MTDVKQLITEYLNIWLTAETEKKSGRGRSSGSNSSIYGVQKLRELILELAICGKIVKQNKHDSCSSILVDNYKALGKSRTKKLKTYERKDENLPFSIPQTWQWVRLGEIFNIVYGKGLSSKELLPEGYPVFGANGIIGCYSKYLYEKEQLLISCRGAYSGKANISPPFCFITSNSLVLENSWTCLNLKCIYYFLSIIDKSKIVTGTAQPQVTTANLETLLIPIPPLEEQHRIVAKVDELMQLCDQLEQQQNLSTEAHEQLVDLLLNALTNSADVDEFQQSWQRISANFDLLFTTDYSIEQLKQTILQLAVMGKLVKQDPSDEPASELLKQITEEKAKLVKEGKIKKSKPLPEITDDEKPFELPSGWEWVRLLNIVDLNGGFAYKSERFINSGMNQVIRMGNIRPDYIRLDEKKVCIDIELAQETKDFKLKENDIVITMTGTRGKKDFLYTAMILDKHLKEKSLFLNQRLANIRAKKEIDPFYLNLAFKVDQFLQPIFDSATGTANQANVGMQALGNMILPLPSFYEQKRIVEKVDQLFSIIDQLYMLQTKARQTQLHLADVLVANAVEGA